MFEQVPRWRFVVGMALGLAAIGLWQSQPTLVIAATLPVGYVVYSALTTAAPVEDRIRLTRRISPTRVYPGQPVTVNLEIEYLGEGPLPDVRIVDDLPSALPVVEGSPRAAFGFRGGDSETISYTVRARYGDFEFGAPTVRTTSVSGASVYTTELAAEGQSQISARIAAGEYPLSRQTTGITGDVTTDRGGEGLEFYATRAYRAGDPANRIDWRQYAKRRELTTVDYRLEEAVDVVVIVDARESAAVAASEDDPTGLELSVYAASEAIDGLLGARNRVGLLTLGINKSETGNGFGWIPTGYGPELRSRIQTQLDEALATTQGDSPTEETPSVAERENSDFAGRQSPENTPAESGTGLRESKPVDSAKIEGRLSSRSQVVMFSPLIDERASELAQELRTAGHAVSVLSPNVTIPTSPGRTLASVDRAQRINGLRAAGVTVIDWNPEDQLEEELERAIPTTGRRRVRQ